MDPLFPILDKLFSNKKDLRLHLPGLSAEETYVRLGVLQAVAVETRNLPLYVRTLECQNLLGINDDIQLEEGVTRPDDGAFRRLLNAEALLMYEKIPAETKKMLVQHILLN